MHHKINIQDIEYTLKDIEKDIWHQLINATHKKQDALRTPALATKAPNGGIGLRTIVLREVQQAKQTLLFHSDQRASKIADIQEDNEIGLLFYQPTKQIQIRIQGKATIHTEDNVAQEQWKKTALGSLKVYLTEKAPGTIIDQPESGIPQELENIKLQREDIERGRKHFAIIQVKAQCIDWLWIDKLGHRRAQFVYQNGGIEHNWLIP